MAEPFSSGIAASAALLAGLAMAVARPAQSTVFSEGAAYERFMGRWSRSLAPLLVRFAGVREGDTVLDVGSGTGALTAAVTAVPSLQIVGIDPSPAYVAHARSQHQSAFITFEVGDAQQLRFDAATFDRTLSLLVLNFIPDARKALEEMKRVTKPTGTIAAAVWDYGGDMQMLRVFWDEAIALHPDHQSKDERHMPFCRRGELAALWNEAGLHEVVETALTIDLQFSSFQDFWAPFLEKQGPAGGYVASLAAPDRDLLRARLEKRLLGDGPDKPITMRARAWAVKGTR